MNKTYSAEHKYTKQSIDLDSERFRSVVSESDIFICAAGFERRAQRVPMAAAVVKNPVVVRFSHGPTRNDKTFKMFDSKFEKIPGYKLCVLDLANLEKFEREVHDVLISMGSLDQGNITLDISGLPNFAICIFIIKIRKIFPFFNLTLFYTEAEEYFPQRKDYDKAVKQAKKNPSIPLCLSAHAVNMFMPSMFSGVALGHNDTCLVVFAGYEPHRTGCVIEATNPSKLVMVYGEPERSDLKWRLDLSKMMHQGIDAQLMRTEESCLTSDINANLELIMQYYEYLYDDHVLSISATNGKIQALAATLAWEKYPDIQLNFPVPTQYLANKFSNEWRETFIIELGVSDIARRFIG